MARGFVPFLQTGEPQSLEATAMILSELASILSARPELEHIPSHRAC